MIKKFEYFHVQHTLFSMSDKRKHIKNLYVGKKTKACNKVATPFPNKWRRSLQNLTKVRITTEGNGSMNMNMEKGRITMNIAIMTLTSMTMNKFLSIESETKKGKKWLICKSKSAKIPIS